MLPRPFHLAEDIILHGGPQDANSAAHLKALDFVFMVQDADLLGTELQRLGALLYGHNRAAVGEDLRPLLDGLFRHGGTHSFSVGGVWYAKPENLISQRIAPPPPETEGGSSATVQRQFLS